MTVINSDISELLTIGHDFRVTGCYGNQWQCYGYTLVSGDLSWQLIRNWCVYDVHVGRGCDFALNPDCEDAADGVYFCRGW